MKSLIIVALLLAAPQCLADSNAYGVNWDHFSTSFLLTTVTYGCFKSLYNIPGSNIGPEDRSRPKLGGLSALTSLAISTFYSAASTGDPKRWPGNDTHKLLWNVLGAGLSSLTTLTFEF